MAQINVFYFLLAISYATANQKDALTRLSDIAVNLVNVVGDKGEIKTDMADMATLISTLTKEAIDLENPKPDALDTRLQKMMCTIQNLTAQQKSTQEAAKVQKDQTDSGLEDILRRLSESERKIQQLEERLAETEDQPFAGFTAWSDIDETFSQGETVQFDQVLFNYGSAYDSSTSKFTCPFPGIYFVTVHVEEGGSNSFNIEAMLDSSTLFNIYVYYTNYETSSTSAMVGCLTDQTIYIKASSSNVVKLYHSTQKCIFSVHLIQPMSENEVTSGRLF